ncbi:family 10 glycosylhydrolase [bacterium]|nr:family 10 glycosylhydrolase [bacterium]
MISRRRLFLLMILWPIVAAMVLAAPIVLKNGRVLDGRIVAVNGDVVQIALGDETIRLPRAQVRETSLLSKNLEQANRQHLHPAGEIRAAWVTRFEWPVKNDPAATRANIIESMEILARNGFNTVFFQVRGQADVLYPSPYEPWSPLIGGDPGFDPLALAIEEAHKRGIALHAYMNVYPVWQWEEDQPWPARGTKPIHPFYVVMGNGGRKDWGIKRADGQPPDFQDIDRYFYFSPGNPEVQAYIRRVVMDVVRRYDVDGIHVDRVRYPLADTSHDDVSEARFKGAGNPEKLDWESWQRDQVTRLLETLKAQINEEKPGLPLTAAVWGICDNTRLPGYKQFSSGYHQFYQDSLGWLRRGTVDGVCPMIYWPEARIPGKPVFGELARDFAGEASGMRILPGMGGNHLDSWSELSREWRVADSTGNGGSIFSLTRMRQHDGSYPALFGSASSGRGALATQRTQLASHVLVTVVDGSGNPVVDATVRMADRSSPGVTAADGRCAFLEVPKGKPLAISASKRGKGTAAGKALINQPGTETVRLVLGQ